MCQSIEERGRRLPGRRRHQIKAFSASAQANVRAKRRSCGTAAASKAKSVPRRRDAGALIGMREGETIAWNGVNGRQNSVTVLKVLYQPAKALVSPAVRSRGGLLVLGQLSR